MRSEELKYEGKTFFEKKVLPLKLPFPKNFSKGREQSDQRERILANARKRGSPVRLRTSPFQKTLVRGGYKVRTS